MALGDLRTSSYWALMAFHWHFSTSFGAPSSVWWFGCFGTSLSRPLICPELISRSSPLSPKFLGPLTLGNLVLLLWSTSFSAYFWRSVHCTLLQLLIGWSTPSQWAFLLGRLEYLRWGARASWGSPQSYVEALGGGSSLNLTSGNHMTTWSSRSFVRF